MGNDVTNDAGAVREIAELARRAVKAEVQLSCGGVAPLLLKPGGAVESLEPFLVEPLRKRATVKLRAVDSFVSYVSAHREAGTMLFANFSEKGGRIEAVIDYHLPTTTPAGDSVAIGGLARRGEHRVVLELESSPEWARWIGASGVDLPQTRFAEFLEENALDVVVPDTVSRAPNSAQMLDVALTLQAKTEVAFSSGVRLSNGQAQLQYHETINATAGTDGKLEVPERFYLSLRPFVGVVPYLIEARLRYRIAGGKLTFRYELARLHRVVEEVCKDTVQRLSEGLKLPVLIGEGPTVRG